MLLGSVSALRWSAAKATESFTPNPIFDVVPFTEYPRPCVPRLHTCLIVTNHDYMTSIVNTVGRIGAFFLTTIAIIHYL